MILGENRPESGTAAATLDELFRRAGIRDPDALALADPPNRESFTDAAPRCLTYSQTDRAISSLAARLRDFGLQADTLVAIQLPNTVESIIAFLAVLRAGMIAVPMPSLWRRKEMVAALIKISPKAILTCSRIGITPHASIATQAAAELFPVRHVFSFGHDLPDGAVGLDDIFESGGTECRPASMRPGFAARHIAAVTFGINAGSIVPMARSHAELVAGGLAVFLECGAPSRENFLSTLPISSFAGIAASLMPWLLSGGSLHLHHGFDPVTFGDQSRAFYGGVVALPAPAIFALQAAGLVDEANRILLALWRLPERLGAARPWSGKAGLVDAVAFGEIGIVAARRGLDGVPLPVPHGAISVPREAIGAMTVIETARSDEGTVLLRGPMVPLNDFPPQADRMATSSTARGYRDTGFACRLERTTQTLSITAPPAGIVTVGGYCFRQDTIEARVGTADPGATIVALPDSDLGQRLAGTAKDRNLLNAGLQSAGVNPLISGAFFRRGAA